jgi:hypothetical protein
MNGKPSSPVLRGLGASDGARLLDPNLVTSELPVTRQEPRPLGFCRTTPTLDSNKGESPSQPARRERNLGLQTYAPKKALESRIRTQAVKRKVGL